MKPFRMETEYPRRTYDLKESKKLFRKKFFFIFRYIVGESYFIYFAA